MCLPFRDNNDPNMITADGCAKCEETPPELSSSTWRRRRREGSRPPAETLHLLSAVLVWLVTGTTISSLNKWIFSVYNFRYPLLLSALHMLTAMVVDYGLIRMRMISRSGAGGQDLTPGAKCKVFLLSLTFCASIAFGNMGLSYVQLSFAQMIYTTTPLFTLAISALILGKQHHILKYTAMMPICLGASFSIMGEVQFDQTGCFLVFAATMLRGVKSIQQSEFYCCCCCCVFCPLCYRGGSACYVVSLFLLFCFYRNTVMTDLLENVSLTTDVSGTFTALVLHQSVYLESLTDC